MCDAGILQCMPYRPAGLPTAASLTEPLSRAEDLRPLASILRVIGTPARLRALQMLMDRPRLGSELPTRTDEMHMLEEVGVVVSRRVERQRFLWELGPETLVRIGCCLAAIER